MTDPDGPKAASALTAMAGELREAQRRAMAILDEKMAQDLRATKAEARATALAGEVERLRAALTEIASFNDGLANDRLGSTGSYALFDEPGAVKIARGALATKGTTKGDQ